ncbi:hypothetical protein JCM3765_004613 [Sporobolomyces pararoseus]
MSTKQEILDIIDKALKVREAGNEKFKQGDYPGALRDYYTVLLSLKGLDGRMQQVIPLPRGNPTIILESDKIKEIDEKAEEAQEKADQENPHEVVKKAILNTHINSAAIHIKMKRWQRALECAQAAQKLDAKHPKAAFREAQARIGLGQISKGRLLLEKILKEVGPDPGVTQALAQLNADDKEREKNKNSQFRGMFQKDKAKTANAPSPAQPQAETETTPSTDAKVEEASKSTPITEVDSSGKSDSTVKDTSDQVSKEAESVAQQVEDEVATKEAVTSNGDSEMKEVNA